jgi:hypothetical protein
MALTHYAQLDEDNNVIYVEIVHISNTLDADGNKNENVGIEYLKSLHGSETRWIETCRENTFRCRYAGVGMIYSPEYDVFLHKKPEEYPSWIFSEETYQWLPPIPDPELTEEEIESGYYYEWNEPTVSWDLKQHEPVVEEEP